MRFEMVGRLLIASRLMAVLAPVRPELNTGSTCAVTVTSSAIATVRSVSTRSEATPRLTETSLLVAGWKPLSVAVMVYGPPTRMPGTENRPSPRVTAS